MRNRLFSPTVRYRWFTMVRDDVARTGAGPGSCSGDSLTEEGSRGMWSQFFIAALVGAVLLYVPGYLVLRGCRLCRLVAVCTAPAVSLAGYEVCAIMLAKLGVFATWATVSLPVLALTVAAVAVGMLGARGGRGFSGGCLAALPGRRVQAGALVAFTLFGLVVAMYFFVRGLDGPASYFQAYDNLSHMGRIKVFVETGNFAPSGNDLFYDLGAASPSTTRLSGFYPSSWHCIAAMLVSLLNISIPMAVNVDNFLFLGLVCPVASCLLACVLFAREGRGVLACAVLAMAFSAYPWWLLNFGPLYPNLAGLALVPAVSACFVLACGAFNTRGEDAVGADQSSVADAEVAGHGATGERVRLAFAFFIALVGMGFTHPNAVFSMAVFLAPFVVYRTFGVVNGGRGGAHGIAGALVAIGASAAIAGAWIALYRAPFMSGVTGYSGWHAFVSTKRAVFNLAVLALRDTPMQPVLALLVAAGAVYALRHRQYLWIVASYGITAVMYVLNASTDGFAKSLLTGFWYQDSYRICALVALVGFPLACLGLLAMVRGARRAWHCRDASGPVHGKAHAGASIPRGAGTHVLGRVGAGTGAPTGGTALAVVLVAVVTMGIYVPHFTVPGVGLVQTAFGTVSDGVHYRNDTLRLDDAYNADERAFVQKVKQVVPEGALILNHPYDGSAFAYATDDLRVYYRYLGTYNGARSESLTSRLIRQQLCFIGEDDRVREAVASTGAHYLLMLDQGDQDVEEHRRYLISYHSDNWPGIERITDDTPGFEVVLSEGDMRLYRITALDE